MAAESLFNSFCETLNDFAAYFDSKTRKEAQADAVFCRTDDIVKYFIFSKLFLSCLIFMDIEFFVSFFN